MKKLLTTLIGILVFSSTSFGSVILTEDKDIEKDFIRLVNRYEEGIRFCNPNSCIKINGLYFYNDLNGEVFSDIRGLSEEDDNYAIAINRKKSTTTVYKLNKDENKYNIPVVSFACTVNKEKTPLGLYHTMDTYRWHRMFNDVYCQYCIRFYEHFLLHSVVFQHNENPNSLISSTYNSLDGTGKSGGCVRFRTGDAKWLYENLKENTPVYIYESELDSPLGRPNIEQIPSNQNYDPTDEDAIVK